MSDLLDRRQFLMLPVFAGALRASDALLVRLPSRKPAEHPEPRPGITAEKILSRAAYEADVRSRITDEKRVAKVLERVSKAFEHAREIPEILDGLYCYCDCHDQGHRSLLVCFEVLQAVGCWSCKEESELAYKLNQDGKSLDEIRKAVDRKFG